MDACVEVILYTYKVKTTAHDICDISRYMGYGISSIGHMAGEPAGKLM